MYVDMNNLPGCSRIIIAYFKKLSDPEPSKTAEVTCEETIQNILDLLSRLPGTGDMMIKMGDVEYIHVTLYIDEGEDIEFEYFEDMIKTEDTSFYSESPEEEKELYILLKSLL